MPKKLALIFLLLTMLACNLPFSDSPASQDSQPTPDIATLVAENLTAAVATVAPLPEPASTPSPEPARANLNVVYARGGNLVLWRESASALALTLSGQDQSPIISDDGQVIAFLRHGELFAIRADGTGERLLVSQSYMDSFRSGDMLSVRLSEFDFAPGSHDIYFSLLGETGSFPAPLNDLQRVNADSAEIAVILAAGSGGGNWTFSPDCQWLALAQANQIRVMRPNGTEDRVVFKFKLVSTYSEWFYFPQVVWRNDSAGFYTVIPASAALENPSEPTRYYYVPLTGEAAKLAEFVAAYIWTSFPFIAPNGIQVAYIRESDKIQSLYVIDASTADRAYTSRSILKIMGWNPDSLRVAYQTSESSEVALLAFGAEPVSLNDTARFSDLEWVSVNRYLFLSGDDLRLRELPGASISIDTGVTGFDFVLLP